MRVLPRLFFDREPSLVARQLLGKMLMRDRDGVMTVGRIVETEAYLARDDPASHAYRGRTKRNAAMFGPPGHAYVYTIHTHCCLNVVTEGENVPSAVLIRAVEPLMGLEIMQRRRGTDRLTALTSGPGKLCVAFAIDRELDAWDVTQGERLWFATAAVQEAVDLAISARVGVTLAGDLPLRFFVPSSACLSRGPRWRGQGN